MMTISDVHRLIGSGVLTKSGLAERAGLARHTVTRVLQGASCNTTTLNRILDAAKRLSTPPTPAAALPEAADQFATVRVPETGETIRLTYGELAARNEARAEGGLQMLEAFEELPAPIADAPAAPESSRVDTNTTEASAPIPAPAKQTAPVAAPTAEPTRNYLDDRAIARLLTVQAWMKKPGSPIPLKVVGPGSKVIGLRQQGWTLLRFFALMGNDLVEFYPLPAETAKAGVA